MQKQFTEDEVREKFLRKINTLVDYWLNDSRTLDTRGKLDGLAFSILATIDGCDIDLPAFVLAPFPSEEDKEYCIENGKDYFPQNHSSNIACDIAGSLHELFYTYRS